jgi:hypothetical protein
MDRDFVHLDQGFCITSYASECRTVKQIVALTPLSALTAMDAKTFYVLASRATHRAIFFTDCKEALKEAALREGDRAAVWDYERKSVPVLEVADLQRDKQVSIPKWSVRISAGKSVSNFQKLLAAGVGRFTKREQEKATTHER